MATATVGADDDVIWGPDPGAGIVDGLPTAIVIKSPGGDLGSYESRTRSSGPRWTCGYHELGLASDTDIPSVLPEVVSPEAGKPYGFLCYDEAGHLVHEEYLVYEPGDPFAGLFAAERAAELALEQLELPLPEVHLNPPAEQVVGVPTWLWLGNAWAETNTSAAIGTVTSTVRATPLEVTWNLGDGTSLVCHGPGTAYDPARAPGEQHTDCRHVYIWPSFTQPGGAYAVSATVRFQVEWDATTGEGGDLGVLATTTEVPIVVREVQALVR